MIRIYTYTLLSLVFLPLALILVSLGINAIAAERKRGIWLKLAVIVNSSLILALGAIGCGGDKSDAADDEEFVTCYMMPAPDVTEIPQTYEDSNDWQTLESSLISIEYYISTESDDTAAVEPLVETARTSIENLRVNGLINDDDAVILSEYVDSRDFYYNTSICGVKCYDVKEPFGEKAQVREDIVYAMDNLRAIYANGDIETPAYETALANLEKQLKLYTGKEDNAVLRQLLLDITDGYSGNYY
ncbi:MAG: hypothetical protein GY771_15800 [bacterium]|nr:hypothetical protein [bacterium]